MLCPNISWAFLQSVVIRGQDGECVFIKDYINHPNIRQTDQPSVTGSEAVQGSTTKNYLGYGVGLRYTVAEALAVKVSYEHSVRLPIARELLGNGTNVYANVALKPETVITSMPVYSVRGIRVPDIPSTTKQADSSARLTTIFRAKLLKKKVQ